MMKRANETHISEEMENKQTIALSHAIFSEKVIVQVIVSFLTLYELSPLAQTCYKLRNMIKKLCLNYRHICHLRSTPIFDKKLYYEGLWRSNLPSCIQIAWNKFYKDPLVFWANDRVSREVAECSSYDTIQFIFSLYLSRVPSDDPGMNAAWMSLCYGFVRSKYFNKRDMEKLMFDCTQQYSIVISQLQFESIFIHLYLTRYKRVDKIFEVLCKKRPDIDTKSILAVSLRHVVLNNNGRNGPFEVLLPRFTPESLITEFIRSSFFRGIDTAQFIVEHDHKQTLKNITESLYNQRWKQVPALNEYIDNL